MRYGLCSLLKAVRWPIVVNVCHFGLLWIVVSLAIISHLLFYIQIFFFILHASLINYMLVQCKTVFTQSVTRINESVWAFCSRQYIQHELFSWLMGVRWLIIVYIQFIWTLVDICLNDIRTISTYFYYKWVGWPNGTAKLGYRGTHISDASTITTLPMRCNGDWLYRVFLRLN